MTDGLSYSAAELERMGYKVQDGKCVPLDFGGADKLVMSDSVRRDVIATHRYGLAPNGRPYRSKWECEYAGWLETEKRTWGIAWWSYECFKLRLADGAYFTPDFPVLTSGGQLVMREVKGHWREAARLRVKVAASQFPWLRIEIISKQKGQWVTLEVWNG